MIYPENLTQWENALIDEEDTFVKIANAFSEFLFNRLEIKKDLFGSVE
jgi:agmatine/peptidylarginine deiminase